MRGLAIATYPGETAGPLCRPALHGIEGRGYRSWVRVTVARKQTALDRGQTDRVGLTLTLTLDLDLKSSFSCGHDPYTCKRSRSKVARFKS